MVYSIHYTGFPKTVTEAVVKSFFKEVGTVFSCTIIESKFETVRGFVNFTNFKECQLAVLKYDGYIYDKDYPLTVKISNKTQNLGSQLNNGYRNNFGKGDTVAKNKPVTTSKTDALNKVAQQNKVASTEKQCVIKVTNPIKYKPTISTQACNGVKISKDQLSDSNASTSQKDSSKPKPCTSINSMNGVHEELSSEDSSNSISIAERASITAPTTAMNKLSLNELTYQDQFTVSKSQYPLPLNTTKKSYSLPELKVNLCLNCGKPAIYTSECCHLVHFCNHLCLHEGWARHQNACPGFSSNIPFSSNDLDSASDYQSPSHSLENSECNDDPVSRNIHTNKPSAIQHCASSKVLACSTTSSSNQKIATRYKLVNINQGNGKGKPNIASKTPLTTSVKTALNDHHKRVQRLAAELESTDKAPTPTRYFHYVQDSSSEKNSKTHGQSDDASRVSKPKANGHYKPLQIFELPDWSASQVDDVDGFE